MFKSRECGRKGVMGQKILSLICKFFFMLSETCKVTKYFHKHMMSSRSERCTTEQVCQTFSVWASSAKTKTRFRDNIYQDGAYLLTQVFCFKLCACSHIKEAFTTNCSFSCMQNGPMGRHPPQSTGCLNGIPLPGNDARQERLVEKC